MKMVAKQTEKQLGIKVGDNVISASCLCGKITGICRCSYCEERGFYEYSVEFENGRNNYITVYDYNSNFSSYYSIGNKVFGNLDKDYIEEQLKEAKEQFIIANKQIELYEKINNKEKHNETK